MDLNALLIKRRDLISQLQALDNLITSDPDTPWVPLAADYIRLHQPALGSEVHQHTYIACQQVGIPAPSMIQLIQTMQAHGFRRTRQAAGVFWTIPAP